MEDDADRAVEAAHELEAGAGVDGVAGGVLRRDGEDGGAAAAEDVLVGLGREVLDHFLGEPELLEDGVGDLFFLEFKMSHVQRSFADSASGCKLRKSGHGKWTIMLYRGRYTMNSDEFEPYGTLMWYSC